jgi:ABC-type transport system involved in multi-copper enzyme maturation permease subunit
LRNRRLAPFVAVFQTELLFNLKRVAPYALGFIFSANAWLWTVKGAAVARGWAINSDFYILRLFLGFSFITGLPLFIALLMGDPVIRDFRVGVDPLIFSKPVGRVQYLLGKFFGNFFVLVCCQGCFALTALLLQAFGVQGMIVLQPRLLPYFQHFFFFVVVSSLALGAVCFTVGTLTRSVKIVYGLAISFYPLYIAWQLSMKGLPMRWRVALDPLLFNAGDGTFNGRSAEWLNQAVVGYDGYMIANRVVMIAVSLVCLAILYLRFSTTERAQKNASTQPHTLTLNLAPKAKRAGGLYNEPDGYGAAQAPALSLEVAEAVYLKQLFLPRVKLVTKGLRAGFEQFRAALGVEFRLLRAERSLIVVAPLIMLLCSLEVVAYEIVPEVSYAATYAGRMANALLLFLSGIAVFYVGETMHRDREARIEPVLWSAPAPNLALLLSKFTATLLLSLTLLLLVALTAIGLQIYKGHTPLELQIHLKTYAVILVPSMVFMIAASVALNILLRDKYLTYAVSLALGALLYYLTGQGYHNWLYNPVLYRLWTPSDLTGGDHLTRILYHRLYCFALSALLLALSFIFFERRSTRGLMAEGRPSGRAWAILIAVVSVAAAVITGTMVSL